MCVYVYAVRVRVCMHVYVYACVCVRMCAHALLKRNGTSMPCELDTFVTAASDTMI